MSIYETATLREIERLEEKAYTAQEEWIAEHCGKEAADQANYGWGVDEVDGHIETKVYGHGVLVTDVETCEHEWLPYD